MSARGNGGHERTKRAPIGRRTSSPAHGDESDGLPTASHGHSSPANHGTSWSVVARLSRWHTSAIIGTDRPINGRRMAPMPCWAKRSQHLGASTRASQPASSNLRSRKSARAAQGRTALITAIIAVTAMTTSLTGSTRRGRGSSTSPRWLKRRQNQGQLAGSQSDVQRRLRLQPLVCERRLYSLCTSVTRIRAVLPRTRTGSVGITSRWQAADGRCSERPSQLQ